MRKIVLLALAGAAFTPALAGTAPAAASCNTTIEETGCAEQIPCQAYGNLYDHSAVVQKLGRMDCIE
jgi:hypothetical protein